MKMQNQTKTKKNYLWTWKFRYYNSISKNKTLDTVDIEFAFYKCVHVKDAYTSGHIKNDKYNIKNPCYYKPAKRIYRKSYSEITWKLKTYTHPWVMLLHKCRGSELLIEIKSPKRNRGDRLSGRAHWNLVGICHRSVKLVVVQELSPSCTAVEQLSVPNDAQSLFGPGDGHINLVGITHKA